MTEKELMIIILSAGFLVLIVFLIVFSVRMYGRGMHRNIQAKRLERVSPNTQLYSKEYIDNLLKTEFDLLINSAENFKGENEKKDFDIYMQLFQMDFFKQIFII